MFGLHLVLVTLHGQFTISAVLPSKMMSCRMYLTLPLLGLEPSFKGFRPIYTSQPNKSGSFCWTLPRGPLSKLPLC